MVKMKNEGIKTVEMENEGRKMEKDKNVNC